MIFEGRELLEEQVKLLLRHGLDDKLAVVGKEKEGAAPACALPSLEDHVAIELGTEGLVEVGQLGAEVLAVHFLEDVQPVEGHLHSLLHSQHVFLFLFYNLVKVLANKLVTLGHVFRLQI